MFIYIITKITLLRVIPTMTFIHFVTGKSSGILSDIFSGIRSGILSGISSGISSNILSGISSGTLCGISFGVDTRGWGPAGNTGRGWSWLRSGREHLAGIFAVEVRQGTLGGDGRGWGPAGNTGLGWSWLRSGREHCGSRIAVGRGRRGGRGGGGRGRRRQAEGGRQEAATDIKSNNPHLAGGEKHRYSHTNSQPKHRPTCAEGFPDGLRRSLGIPGASGSQTLLRSPGRLRRLGVFDFFWGNEMEMINEYNRCMYINKGYI